MKRMSILLPKIAALVLAMISLAACARPKVPEIKRAVYEVTATPYATAAMIFTTPVITLEPSHSPTAMATAITSPTAQASDANEASVWISPTGTRYHSRADCGTMDPEKAVELSLARAIDEGYLACKNCVE